MSYKLQLPLCALLLTTAVAACSDDDGLAKYRPEQLHSWLGGEADPNQTWITSKPVTLNIQAKAGSVVTAQCIGKERTTVLGQKVMSGSGLMTVDVPQGEQTSFGLVCDDGSVQRQYVRIDLSDELPQIENVDFMHPDLQSSNTFTPQAVAAPGIVPAAAPNKALYGSKIMDDCGYLNFGSWAWDDVALALQEGLNSKNNHKALIDYEIMARGEITPLGELRNEETVYISMLYGHTGTYSSRVLGYYTYSKDYSDIQFYDITEALLYDFIDGKAKVQYQLDGRTNKWYDANFDYKDGDGLPAFSGDGVTTPCTTGSGIRQRDDVYNTLLVSKAYGDRVTAVRGLTYQLHIGKGKTFGFYLRTTNAITAAQKANMMKLGIPEESIPQYAANYTCAAMNTGVNNYRSGFAIYDNFTFMGLDDNTSGGDYDCNDVTFALCNVRGEKFVPKFTDKTLDSDWNKGTMEEHPEYGQASDISGQETVTDLQKWTLGFEDSGINTDFDFNDVVLQVIPNTKANTVAVKLMAAGGFLKAEIYYDSPTRGEVLLGESHALFGIELKKVANTGAEITYDPVLLADSLDWPEGSTMTANRDRFLIKVYDESGTHVVRTVRGNSVLPEDPTIPQVLCVSDEWQWPQEGVRATDAYSTLGHWGREFNNPDNWNWHGQGNVHKLTKPKKKKNK